jgi:hypothetical protein
MPRLSQNEIELEMFETARDLEESLPISDPARGSTPTCWSLSEFDFAQPGGGFAKRKHGGYSVPSSSVEPQREA